MGLNYIMFAAASVEPLTDIDRCLLSTACARIAINIRVFNHGSLIISVVCR